MGFPNGDIKISNNFELNAAKALDARTTVADLASRDAIDFKYAGLIVYVGADKKPYVCTNPAGAGTWKELGGGDFIPRTGTVAGFPLVGNIEFQNNRYLFKDNNRIRFAQNRIFIEANVNDLVSNADVINMSTSPTNFSTILCRSGVNNQISLECSNSFNFNASSILIQETAVYLKAVTNIELLAGDQFSSAFSSISLDANAIYITSNDGFKIATPGSASAVGLKSSPSTSNYTLTLPTADGTAGQTMITDGAGNLSFATVGGGGDFIPLSGTNAITGDLFSNSLAYRVGVNASQCLNFYETATNKAVALVSFTGSLGTSVEASFNAAKMFHGILNQSWTHRTFSAISSSAFLFDGQDARYAGNYASSYTLRSLVDKNYVDTLVATKENGLGNPTIDGQVLSSSVLGVRSWITPSGGAPSLTATRIAFGSPTNTIADSADFSWNDTTKTLFINQGNIRANQGIFKITINGLESAMKVDRNQGRNTSLGYLAFENGAGDNNTALGSEALFSATSASNSIALGVGALYSATTASHNIAIGVSALFANNGGQNIAIGSNSLRQNTLGNLNIGVGVGSLEGNINGNFNVAIGYNALRSAGAGFGNVAIGGGCFLNLLTGSENNAIGGGAFGNLLSGSGNISIGEGSGGTLTNGSFNILLGRYSQTSSPTATNEMNIGGYANDAFISVINVGNGGLNDSGLPGTSVLVKTSDSFGTNIASGHLFLAAGRSTGTANGGSIEFRTAPGGSVSNNVLNNLVIRMRIGASGNIFIANTSLAPPATPVGGGQIYVEAGALKYIGSSGTTTILAAA